MPRNGKALRITLVVAAAALLAVIAVAAASAARAKSSATTLTGAGSSLVAPAVSGVWGPAYSSAKGVNVNYSSIGSGKGIAAITARTVDFGASDAPLTPDQATACKGCVQVPWALAGNRPRREHPRRQRPAAQADRRRAGEDLSRPDHELERPGHREAQPGPQPAEQVDHGRPPQRRLGRHVRLHRLPLQGQQDLGVEGRQRDDRQLARGRRRQRKRRRGSDR